MFPNYNIQVVTPSVHLVVLMSADMTYSRKHLCTLQLPKINLFSQYHSNVTKKWEKI